MVFEETISSDLMATFTAIVKFDANLYVATCPEIGTASQGKTIESAIANLKEATELYLEEFPQKESSKPMITFFEVKVVGETKNNFRKRLR